MSGNLIAGFAPVNTGNTGTGFKAGAGEALESTDAFGALLDSEPTAEPAPDSAPQPAPVEYVASEPVAREAADSGLVEATAPLEVEFSLEIPVEPAPDSEALLADLVASLSALDRALENGETVSPTLAARIAEGLDALASLLGLPPLGETGVDPALAEALAATGNPATGLPADIVAALLALGGASQPTSAVTAAAPVVADPNIPLAPLPPGTADAGSTPPPNLAPAIDPASELGQLVSRLGDLAEALEPLAPTLAGRLDALLQKLTSGELSAKALAELGFAPVRDAGEALGDAVQKLLVTPAGAKEGAPVPVPAPPIQLELLEPIALPDKPKPPVPAAPPAVTPPAEAAPKAPSDPAPKLVVEPVAAKPAERSEPQAAPRNATGDGVRMAPARSDGVAAEPAQPAQQAATTPAAAAAAVAATVAGKSVHAAYQAPVQQINIPQVAFEVVRQVQAGNSRFQIRLDPPELGRIDVRLDVDRSGNVNARLVVERSETLDLMQRDQRALERALAQAGLDTSKTNLEFSLRHNPFGQQNGGDGRGKGTPFGGGGDGTSAIESAPEPTIQSLYRGSTSASGVNLFV